jgi:PadR family transcriptional regulator PadR
MNRRKDELIPIEVDTLAAVLALQKRGIGECHGFLIGKTLETAGGSGSLVGHGTLYKARARLEERQLLKSRWEGDAPKDRRRGPRRRLYKITASGQRALSDAIAHGATFGSVLRPVSS